MANFTDVSFLPKQDIEATARYALTNSIGLDCSYPVDLFSLIESWGIDVVVEYSPEPYLAKILLTQCPKIIINTQKSIDEIKAEILIKQEDRHTALGKIHNCIIVY